MKNSKKIKVLTSEQATLMGMPKYNGFGIGYGPHVNKKKYNRKKKYKDEYD